MLRPIIAVLVLAAFALGLVVARLVPSRESAAPPAAAPAAATPAAPQPLYWYDPMHPEQHFDRPGKSPYMDMQLVPKYADEAGVGSSTIALPPRLVQNLGVRTATARRGRLEATLRATGAVAFDERAIEVVEARVDGIVERLEVRAPLESVSRGQPLLTLIAPEWTAAQEEYLALRASKSPDLEPLRDAARQRLALLGMSAERIASLDRTGRAQPRIVLTAPRAGVVAELSVREGARVDAGTPLMRINGLDTVWVLAAIPESEAASVAAGSKVEATVRAFGDRVFAGRVESLLPRVDPATRTIDARIVLENADHRLAPGMFASLTFAAPADAGDERVLVPDEAVIDTGARRVVIVDDGGGRFRAQVVRVGATAGGETEIVEGIELGEKVVRSGQFLIDSEASLSGALSRLGAEPPK